LSLLRGFVLRNLRGFVLRNHGFLPVTNFQHGYVGSSRTGADDRNWAAKPSSVVPEEPNIKSLIA
jgi:hypothetical protein